MFSGITVWYNLPPLPDSISRENSKTGMDLLKVPVFII